ncbi:hypothetical protein TNCT_428441 [Trichonephila clavata]|uniref:Uncharacterized protein n=1 Tax=Trichonephila clavata TaxID=2740835 RepID=A0A8X6I0Y3_TRICU|nr:hypothetical protein TNCT_428441 [Trichonephila clavata]
MLQDVGNYYQSTKCISILSAVFLVRSLKWIFPLFFFNGYLAYFLTPLLITLLIIYGLKIQGKYIITGKLLIMCAMLFLVNSYEMVAFYLNDQTLLRFIPSSCILLFMLFEVLIIFALKSLGWM